MSAAPHRFQALVVAAEYRPAYRPAVGQWLKRPYGRFCARFPSLRHVCLFSYRMQYPPRTGRLEYYLY